MNTMLETQNLQNKEIGEGIEKTGECRTER
jgi:hypothetical protein